MGDRFPGGGYGWRHVLGAVDGAGRAEILSETYTFTVTGDDGVRLSVNGTLVVDAWVDRVPHGSRWGHRAHGRAEVRHQARDVRTRVVGRGDPVLVQQQSADEGDPGVPALPGDWRSTASASPASRCVPFRLPPLRLPRHLEAPCESTSSPLV